MPSPKIITKGRARASKEHSLESRRSSNKPPINREIKYKSIEKEVKKEKIIAEIKIEDDEDELEDQIPRFILPQMELEGNNFDEFKL